MNSYIRQTAIPADQMHSFLKDKQAWENAIGMYQGPDPLDHWYNYVCWYENHGHGDPENKFRETLERCLTLFEHNDYYKQDPRMTRLWLKYIDMQSNPLHFYQVLYQRGVGRQLAAFYVSWAGYYESMQAAKEAESVYNLGFQEKALPYVELHHAYNKFVYTRNAAAAASAALQQQQQAQVQKVVASHQYATAAAATVTATTTTTIQHHGHQVSQAQSYHRQLQQQQQQHLYHQQAQSTQHVSYQQSPHTTPLTTPLHTHANHQHTHPHHQHQPQPPHVHQHPHVHHPPQQPQPPNQLHHHHHPTANPNQNQQHQHQHQHQPTHTHMPPQHEHHQLTTPTQPSPQQTQPQTLHQQQQQQFHQQLHHQHQHQQHLTQPQQTLSHHHNQLQHQHQHHPNQHQSHHHQQNQQTNHLQAQLPHSTTEVDAAVTSTVSHYHLQQQQQAHMNGTIATSGALYQAQQQQLHQQHPVISTVTTTSAATNTQVQIHQHYERVQHELNHVAVTEPVTGATANQDSTTMNSNSNTNNINAHHVDNESIGGIRLPRRFAAYCRNNYETWKPALFLEEPADPSRHCHYAKNLVYPGDGCEYSPEELRTQHYAQHIEALRRQDAAANQQQQQEQQPIQLQPSASASSDDALSREPPFEGFYTHEQQRQLQHQHLATLPQYSLNGVEYRTHVTGDPDNSEENVEDEYERGDEYEAADDAEDEEDENDEEEEEEGLDADDANEDDDEDDAVKVSDLRQRQMLHQQQQQHLQHMQAQQQFHHIVEDVEDQIEASTIRLSQNKTIKIKFRKERSQMGESFNGSGNYSAYTIENIYQHETASHATLEEQMSRRNGHHSFHPYLMGQTSTPKASVKRSKSKLKRANKFQAIAGSSSNSSSAENAAAMHMHDVEHLPHGSVTDATSNGHTTNGGGNSGTGGDGSASGGHHNVQNVNYNDNANYSFLSAATLENSNCSLTSAVDRMNFRDTTVHGNQQRSTNDNNNTTITNNNSHTNNNNVADFSTYQENSYFATQHDTEAKERRLQKALEAIERHLAKDAIDPFNSELCRAFLTKLDFPGAEEATHANYKIIQTPLPKIANSRALTLPDGLHFNIDKEVGRGSYGSVYKATDVNSGAVVALKFQKPPNTWEIYICDQVLKRVKSPSVLPGLMDVSTAIIAPNASLIATEFSPFGSLLDINNKIRQATSKVMHESLVMHFTAQICNIIQHLHRQQIIHADIKPDNFLLMRIPNTDLHYPSLRLIDFGCAIDMTLFPEQTKFRKVIQTDGFTCIEMQEGRPWSYETDLFCIAGTVHVMLMGEYMQLQKRAGTWDIKQKLPRYLKKHAWTKFFGGMLNIRNGSKLPDLCELRALFDEEAAKMDSELQKQIRTLSNILYRR